MENSNGVDYILLSLSSFSSSSTDCTTSYNQFSKWRSWQLRFKYRRGSQSPFGSIRSCLNRQMLTHFMLGHRPLLDNIISTFTQGRPRLPQSLLILPSNCCHTKCLIDSLYDLLRSWNYLYIYLYKFDGRILFVRKARDYGSGIFVM